MTDYQDFKESSFINFHQLFEIGSLRSSDISSDCEKKKKTAEQYVYLNNHKQTYGHEQQFSISSVAIYVSEKNIKVMQLLVMQLFFMFMMSFKIASETAALKSNCIDENY